MLLSSGTGSFSEADPQVAVFNERANFGGKLLNILRVAQNDAVFSVLDDLTDTRLRAGDDRQPAGHGLENRQAISVFQRRANVGIRRGVELHDVLRRRQKRDTTDRKSTRL